MRGRVLHQFRTAALAGLLAAAPLVARATDADSTKVGSAPTAHAFQSSTRPPPLQVTDPQIFGILNAANTGEIDAGKLALQKSGNEDVRTFAAMMVKDHTALNDQGAAVASKINVTPVTSGDSQKITDDSKKTAEKLRDLDGDKFDKAYVASQVEGHKKVLHLIDRTLLPSAKDPQIKEMLEKARPTIAMHLKHAEHLQAELKKSTKTAENP